MATWAPWRFEPLPAAVTPTSLAEVEANLLAFAPLAGAAEIMGQIETLRAHYGEWSDANPGLAQALWRDWITDLSATPAHLLSEACRRWRTAANRKPPSPGELLALVAPELRELVHLRRQIARAKKELAKLAVAPV